MVERARLESVYTSRYRGFESHPLCQIKKARQIGGPFLFGREDAFAKYNYLRNTKSHQQNFYSHTALAITPSADQNFYESSHHSGHQFVVPRLTDKP